MNVKTNKIIVTPVKKYAPPKYPTRLEAINSPELLRKLPSRWKKNTAVVAAITLIGAITLTSCEPPRPQVQGRMVGAIPFEQEAICDIAFYKTYYVKNSLDEYTKKHDEISVEVETESITNENLRTQVRDFIEWLQGQDII